MNDSTPRPRTFEQSMDRLRAIVEEKKRHIKELEEEDRIWGQDQLEAESKPTIKDKLEDHERRISILEKKMGIN